MFARLTNSRLVLGGIRQEGATVVIDAAGLGEAASCPTCGTSSQQVHDCYVRRPQDLPWRGRPVRLRVRVRRFCCPSPACPKRTFAERFDPALPRSQRRTADTAEVLVRLGLSAGGEGGARLAAGLGVPVSPDTVLRLLRRTAVMEQPRPTALGVDDLALRRGRRYATLLVDLTTHAPIDLLEGREAETLAAWLRVHPGVQVLARDRAEAYAEAGRQAAPDAVQVADRWHLDQNASAALEEVLRSRKRHLELLEPEPTVLPALPPRPPGQKAQHKAAARARRVARWEEVCRRRAAGESILGIARALKMDRRTVRHLLAHRAPPRHRPRPSQVTDLSSPSLQPYTAYLAARWTDGCTNISQLYRELVVLGYTRTRSLLAQALLPWRGPRPPPGPDGRRTRRRPRLRRVSLRWLCLRPPEQLRADEQVLLQQALAEDGELATGYALLQRFRRLVATRDLPALAPWLADAQASGLASFISFARGVEADRAAVDAALTLPWSTGPVEGHVHRVKLLKRRGYGRAKLDLLRRLVLARDEQHSRATSPASRCPGWRQVPA
jgi:transposase